MYLYGGFLKWWYPTTMGFPTKNDHFGVFLDTAIFGNIHIAPKNGWLEYDPFLVENFYFQVFNGSFWILVPGGSKDH